ncbi:telomeric repeat-binding factor 2-like [Toxotes jaculatrix]|uniref:telomeric repeat-binding factor 2-like n=1 Tax=Toxotes jaculatrix TaxID=941984 RepID=UPI001B3AADCB|nr:telomeric repeat-binding factor 2-like [Toxotes jaculatrix]
MAATETVNSQQTDYESIVNRWLVDYYFFLAVDAFKKERYDDFCGIRDVLNSVLPRPLQSTDVLPTKILVLQFLSRINEGERLDVYFESDQSITPLESALKLLEKMSQGCNIPQDYDNVCTSVREMMVGILIKNNEFAKAKEVLNKYFPKPMVGKKAVFMGLISKKSKMHKVIEQVDFRQFREEMLAFCQRLCPVGVPFLHKAAQQLNEKLTEQDNKAATPDEQEEPGPSCSLQINTALFVPCQHTTIQRTRLEAAYQALAAGSHERTFAQLEEEVEREEQVVNEDLSLRLSPSPRRDSNEDSEQDGLFQRDSGSPMEASPADQPPQTDAACQTQAGSLSKTPSVQRNRRIYTVARLVVEPDSQTSSQCSAASQELETEARAEDPPQAPTVSSKQDPQSPLTDSEVTKPSRKHRKRTSKKGSRASTSLAELSTDSEEDPPDSVANRHICVGKQRNQTKRSLRNSTKSKQLSSDCEEDPQESSTSFRTPVRRTQKQLTSDPPSNDPGSADDVRVIDSSMDSSPSLASHPPVPQTSSTPHRDSAQDKISHSKWKQLYNNAKESKERWSDEESYFTSRKKSGSNESTISNSGPSKRKWTESETQKLKEGVKEFGEGNWSKIKAYYAFSGRTNVNLKDRWRTLKKLNMV